MVFNDAELIAEAYNRIVSEAKKTKKPDDGDGIPNWAEKRHSKDNTKSDKKEEPKKKPAFLKKEGLTFKDLFNRVISEKKKEYDMKGAFHDESDSNPKLKKDREKLKKQREEANKKSKM